MRRTIQGLTVAGVMVAGLVFAGPALAMKKTVCASGCAFNSIQSAITAATSGATITIAPGTYTENVVVTKPVTLLGSGTSTVIEPAVSNPVCSPGSLCEGAASNIILVQADNVTVTKLKLEGDNPSLTSGVVRNGKDIDARNGIITNHLLGTYNNLTVSKVSVADIYLRGIYASSEGSFNLTHDTVENVEGSEESIAIFDFGGSGVVSRDTVSKANDAISANWSRGTQFLDNRISEARSTPTTTVALAARPT
jgi:nitrous oxidase accessory protein NosD